MYKICALILACLTGYSLNAQSWQAMQDIPEELAFPVVVELRGNIHVIGGGGPGGATDLHLRYTPSTDSWDTLPPVPYIAQQPAGAVVDDKIHFCGGGYPTTGQRLDYHYYYDPDSVQWYPVASLPVATAIHKAVAFDGNLYVLSGQPDKFLCEYYDPANDMWYQKNALPDQNFWYGAIVATNNTIYRFGGGAYFAPSNAAHKYDQANDTWIPLPSLPQALHAPAGVSINDSLICLSGGYSNGETDKTWIYNINTQAYYPSDSLPVARAYHSMVVADSCVFSVGGNKAGIPAVGVSLLKNCMPSVLTSVSSIEKEKLKPYSVIYTPNSMQIQFNTPALHEDAAVKIVDISGRTVYVQRVTDGNGNITISNQEFDNGIYIVMFVIGKDTYVEQWNILR